MSLSFEWCKCDGYGPKCKHILAFKMIVAKELSYLLNLLFNIFESNGLMDPLDANES